MVFGCSHVVHHTREGGGCPRLRTLSVQNARKRLRRLSVQDARKELRNLRELNDEPRGREMEHGRWEAVLAEWQRKLLRNLASILLVGDGGPGYSGAPT